MKKIASRLKDIEFTEHIDDMQLALFRDHKLDEESEEEVFKHLAQCKRCRDVLKVASEIETEEKRLKPANNLNYKGALQRLGVVASFAIVFLVVPQVNQEEQPSFKGITEEKNIFEEAIDYWEEKFEAWFNPIKPSS